MFIEKDKDFVNHRIITFANQDLSLISIKKLLIQ